jgi:hypothetical protein
MKALLNERPLKELEVRDSLLFIPISRQKLTLTTHRVRSEGSRWGTTRVESIMLEAIDSCGTVRCNYPVLLVAGVLCLFVGSVVTFASNLGLPPILFGMLSALVFFMLYFSTRMRTFRVSSSASGIVAYLTGSFRMEEVDQFLDYLEAAKNARYLMHAPDPAAQVARVTSTQTRQ